MSFNHQDINYEKLRSLILEKMTIVRDKPDIEGVYFKPLPARIDGRGDLTELWSKPWSENENVEPVIEHVYYNTTHEGVVKAWHVHEKTVSQYTCVQGKMQIVLIDVRSDSSTYLHTDIFFLGTKNPGFIKIPPGVLKGWKSLQGDSVIVNFLTSSDVSDNFKYPWESISKEIWEPQNG